jgi:hypothetical protein
MREHDQFCKLHGTSTPVGATDLGCTCLRLFQIRQYELRRAISILKKELATYNDYAELVLKPKDLWQEALDREPLSDWYTYEDHLRAAVFAIANATHHINGESRKFYRSHLIAAAQRVRAMTPEGAQWQDPWTVDPGDERSALRAAFRSLLLADEHRSSLVDPDDGFNNMDRIARSLAVAEASLHGLWLAVSEED